MNTALQPPPGVRNVPPWEDHCRRVHARAIDLLQGRLGLAESAVELDWLAVWTQLEKDPDLAVFRALLSELGDYPIGEERSRWSPAALAREDEKLAPIVEKWRQRALEAAGHLVGRFEWALEARNRRREKGHAV